MLSRVLFIFLISSMIISSCVMESPYEGLAPGPWRAVLKLDSSPVPEKFVPKKRGDDLSFEETSEGELPFNFEVNYEGDSFYVEIINGEERIQVRDIHFGRDTRTGRDTVLINFPHYESRIEALYEERIMEGKWIDEGRKNYSIPFVAVHGQVHRFSTLKKSPKFDLNGKWEVTFEVDKPEDSYKGIGEFIQNGNYLTGTFLTETGDYRFLQGTVQEDKAYLSCFDGHHAFLFEARLKEDGSLLGAFWSGKHYKAIWEAKRNPDFELANPYDLTFLKEGFDKVSFTLPDTEGNMVSIDDDRFKGKVKIIQILGTWCPNCADETRFLSEYYNNLKSENLAIIGLAFEKHREAEKSKVTIDRFKKRFDVQYDVLFANGSSSKIEAAEVLPMLNHVLSYPTMIIIDKQDKVRRIHTGFAGPATSKYDKFTKEFDVLMKELLAENPES